MYFRAAVASSRASQTVAVSGFWQWTPMPRSIAHTDAVARDVEHRFWLLVVYYVVHTSVWWGMMTWLPSYLKTARGFSWTAMGALSSLPYVLGIVGKFAGGYLSDKAGRRAPFMAAACVGIAAGIFLGATVESNIASAMLLTLAIFASSIGVPSGWSMLQDIVPSRVVSTGAGVMN